MTLKAAGCARHCGQAPGIRTVFEVVEDMNIVLDIGVKHWGQAPVKKMESIYRR